MIDGRSGPCLVFDDKEEEIYVIGGYGEGNLNKCEKYSTQNNSWQQINTMSKGKYFASACIFANEYIYVIGGYCDGNYVNTVEKYSITQNKWEIVKIPESSMQLPPISQAFCHQFNSEFVLIAGGYDHNKNEY